MTTHNLDRAMESAGSVAVLAQGKIAYRGSLDSVAAESIRDTYVKYTDGAL
jgi:ABC-type multidrug transport system ATPase subunit